MERKIIQIIPAHPGFFSYSNEYRETGEGERLRRVVYDPIVCYALVEYEDGERDVFPMMLTESGVDMPSLDEGLMLGRKCEGYVNRKEKKEGEYDNELSATEERKWGSAKWVSPTPQDRTR